MTISFTRKKDIKECEARALSLGSLRGYINIFDNYIIKNLIRNSLMLTFFQLTSEPHLKKLILEFFDFVSIPWLPIFINSHHCSVKPLVDVFVQIFSDNCTYLHNFCVCQLSARWLNWKLPVGWQGWHCEALTGNEASHPSKDHTLTGNTRFLENQKLCRN